MSLLRRVVLGIVALAAGGATAGAVALGADDAGQTLTINGDPHIAEASREKVLTINGTAFSGQTLTVVGRALSGPGAAAAGADFEITPQVVRRTGTLPNTLTINGVVDDEADEGAETLAIDALAAGADGRTTTAATRTLTIADDDGALDQAVCSGLLRPVGLLLSRLRVAGLFEGCSPR